MTRSFSFAPFIMSFLRCVPKLWTCALLGFVVANLFLRFVMGIFAQSGASPAAWIAGVVALFAAFAVVVARLGRAYTNLPQAAPKRDRFGFGVLLLISVFFVFARQFHFPAMLPETTGAVLFYGFLFVALPVAPLVYFFFKPSYDVLRHKLAFMLGGALLACAWAVLLQPVSGTVTAVLVVVIAANGFICRFVGGHSYDCKIQLAHMAEEPAPMLQNNSGCLCNIRPEVRLLVLAFVFGAVLAGLATYMLATIIVWPLIFARLLACFVLALLVVVCGLYRRFGGFWRMGLVVLFAVSLLPYLGQAEATFPALCILFVTAFFTFVVLLGETIANIETIGDLYRGLLFAVLGAASVPALMMVVSGALLWPLGLVVAVALAGVHGVRENHSQNCCLQQTQARFKAIVTCVVKELAPAALALLLLYIVAETTAVRGHVIFVYTLAFLAGCGVYVKVRFPGRFVYFVVLMAVTLCSADMCPGLGRKCAYFNTKPFITAGSVRGEHAVYRLKKDTTQRYVLKRANRGLDAVDVLANNSCKPAGPTGINSFINNFFTIYDRFNQNWSVGITGGGIGGLTAYAKPGQSWHIYEPDIALFNTLETLGKKIACLDSAKLVNGRLSRMQVSDIGVFDVIIVNTFYSPQTPYTELGKEAFAAYFRQLKSGGIVLVRVPPGPVGVAQIARQTATFYNADVLYAFVPDAQQTGWIAGQSSWLAVSQNPQSLSILKHSGLWRSAPVNNRLPVIENENPSLWPYIAVVPRVTGAVTTKAVN